jgi:MSHA biogenesis protein MshL
MTRNFICKVLLALVGVLSAGCSQLPVKASDAHLRAPDPAPAGNIPPHVQVAPILPKPRPVAKPETYSVVVNNVRVQDLLFALARDARLNIDVHPDIAGTVTLNAIDQTLPQILNRMARQVDLRYEMDGQNLVILRDIPFLRAYRVDYLSAARNVRMQSNSNTQFASSSSGGGGGGGTGATASINVNSENQLWDSIVANVKDILQETDKLIPSGATGAGFPASAPPAPQAPAAGVAPAQTGITSPPASNQAPTFREAAHVIANRETGILYVRATSKQHEKVQEFLDQVITTAKRQVLIEATVAEVQLNNQYQRGIDWSRVRTGGSGFSLIQTSANTPAGIGTNAFTVGYATAGINFTSAVKLLESFGDVKVLSSPKLSVMNNQTALLRVTRDIVYFTMTPSSTSATAAGGGTVVAPATFTTTPNVAAEGFMMSVLPQINEADAVVLNVRPTIRRKVGDATDPNPALTAANPNLIPIFETREFDSILRIQSGQIAVLGGLMQDSATNIEDTIPGIRDIPGLGQLLAQRKDTNLKTELVIFLRATVVRDPTIDGDFREFRDLLPTQDFMNRQNPARSRPSVSP